MNIPPPEANRTKVVTGSIPSPRLQNLATSYPFIQQVDVVFPSSDSLEAAFLKLNTRFMRGNFGLFDVYEQFASPSERASETLYLTKGDTDDKWCIDPRGVLTLCVTKDTYQRLGVVGSKLLFKGCPEQYVIRIPLYDRSESVGMKANRKKALQDWDRRREEDGQGKWDVIFCHPFGLDSDNHKIGDLQQLDVKPIPRTSSSIHAPIPSSSWTRWPQKSDSDETQEWDESMGALFEWVGMACFGAQRMEVNDRVDPFVAVYSPPSPSQVGTITHLRWRGLLGPAFVQSIIDSAISSITTANPSSPFVSITAQAFATCPVTHIPPGAAVGGTGKEAPLRVPRSDAEHCWSLILVPGSSSKRHETEVVMHGDDGETMGKEKGGWIIAESIGKWDMRWG